MSKSEEIKRLIKEIEELKEKQRPLLEAWDLPELNKINEQLYLKRRELKKYSRSIYV